MREKWYEKGISFLRSMKLQTRLTLTAVIVLWLGVGIQAVMSRIAWQETDIVEAFSQVNSERMESSMVVLAECPDGFVDNEARVRALYQFADGLGLVIDGAFEKRETADRTEISYTKNGKYAQTTLKTVELYGDAGTADYVLVRLTIYQDTDSILHYQELAERLCEKAGCEIIQSRISLIGSYGGKLSAEARDQMTEHLLAVLSGSVAYESRKEEDYTIYAYSPGIRDYVIAAGKKINIQIIMEYDPEKDRTKVTVASPAV
ncbi:MAG: YwmB family TATA-box binding protein [Lachnospiraceae bacterium]|nr:YwmB family TATA-box binding protein [Lachnospiraceae bacterium]